MEAVVGLLLMLLRVSHGVESYCDGRKDGAVCHGALGGAVNLQLMNNTSELWDFELRKVTNLILKRIHGKIVLDFIEERYLFISESGTFRINNLSRSDGGSYTFTLFKNQKNKGEWTLTLSIQAPVTSVQLTSECLSLGNKRANCSSEGGDSPQYSWTLNGRPLTDDQLLNGTHETNSVTLKLHVSGRLDCWVHNHVSNVSKSVELTTCGFIFMKCTLTNGTKISEWVHEAASKTLCVGSTADSTTREGKENGTGSVTLSSNITSSNQTSSSDDEHWYSKIVPILAGVLGALLVLMVVTVVIIRKQKNKQNTQPAAEGDDEELTYADVRSVQLRARPVQPISDMGVEYGQVKFSERPRRTETSNYDSLYSEVRPFR